MPCVGKEEGKISDEPSWCQGSTVIGGRPPELSGLVRVALASAPSGGFISSNECSLSWSKGGRCVGLWDIEGGLK